MNERTDRAISQHVTSMHRYLAPGQEEGTRASEQLLLDQDENTNNIEGSVFEKTNRHLYRHLLRDDEVSDEEEEGLTNEELALIQAQKEEYLSIGFLKKFLHYAKVRVKPILTIEASEAIRRAYHVFRGRKDQETNGFSGSGGNTVHLERTLPVTPRTLETLIRLATAHAKLRLSHVIEDEDVQVAESMLRFCLYKEVVKIKKNKKAKKAKNEEKSKDEKVTGTPAGQVKDFENLSLQDVVEKDVFEFPKDTKKKRGARAIFNDDDDDEGLSVAVSDALSSDEGNLSDATIRAAVEDEFLEDEVLANFTTIGNETTTDVVLSEECKAWIRSALNRLQVTATASGDFLPISTLMQDLERSHTIPPTIDQVEIVLKNLSDEGLIYLSPEGDIVFL